MRRVRAKWSWIANCAAGVAFLFVLWISGTAHAGEAVDVVDKRTTQLDMYPCSDCHSGPADFNEDQRIIPLNDEHLNIRKIHPKQRVEMDPNWWCHNCHTPGDYNKLRLYTGETIGFNESHRLCGQCHGPQLRDWKRHIHGRRSGSWDGEGKVELCVQCHNSHDTVFKPMKPLPPPPKPAWMTRGEGGAP